MSKVSYKIIHSPIVKTKFNILDVYLYRNRLYTYKYTPMCMCVYLEKEKAFQWCVFILLVCILDITLQCFLDQ